MVKNIGSKMVQLPSRFTTRMSAGIMDKRHVSKFGHPAVEKAMANLRTQALPLISSLLGNPTTYAELQIKFVEASFECSAEASVYSRAFGEVGVHGAANSLLGHYDSIEKDCVESGEKYTATLPSFVAIALQLSRFNSADELRDHEVALAQLLSNLSDITSFQMETLEGPNAASGSANYLYLEMAMVQDGKINAFVKDLLVAAENKKENLSDEVDIRYSERDYY